MKKKHYFIVEGKTDLVFMRDFLKVNFNLVSEMQDKDLKNIKLSNDFNSIVINNIGGKDKLKNEGTINLILSEINRGDFNNVLIFLDCDYESNGGGLGSTKMLLNDIKNFDFKFYIFPNNKDEGTIENLLENIISDKYKDIFSCWTSFENCLKLSPNSYNLPAKKSKIYLYLEALHGNTKNEKEKL